MFAKTRRRLALNFAGLMIIFLILVNAISYYLLSSIIYNDREKEILQLVNLEAKTHTEELLEFTAPRSKEHEKDDTEEDDDDDHGYEGEKAAGLALVPFVYVLDATGKRINGDVNPSRLEREMISLLQEWDPDADEIRYERFEYDEKPIRYVFTGRSLFDDHRYIGSVYAGMDITQETNVLHQYVLILISLSGFFLLGSIFLGYLMAGGAMKPIIRSFTKQQQFTADASHELRTPLSVILSSLEVIEAEEGKSFSPFTRRVLDDLKDEVKRMSQLIANLLTLARADSSDIQLHVEAFSLDEELERVYRIFQPIANKEGQQLLLDLSPNLRIHADRERIVQLILILLDNALQYSDKPGTITISGKVSDKMATLSVADSGKGIPLNRQKDIFERFYRIDSSRNRTGNQTGLGLSIAKWIVEAHHGTIKVDSIPGQGSTFTILLPRNDQ